MLLFDKITKKYDGDIVALDDVSFFLDKGEFSFIVGPSGAGKTTLMKLLIREEIPTSGSIIFDEMEVNTIPDKLLPKYRQKLGIVFQDIKLLESKTLEENIAFALEIIGKEEKEILETTQYLLEMVKLQDRRHLFPRQLSGCEQQRGAIARALANNPDLLIADEPTGNLDPDNSFQILDILRNINKHGTTVMVISHDKEIVDFMKTRVIRIEAGKVVSDNKGDYRTVKKPKGIPTEIKAKSKTEEDVAKEEKEDMVVDENLAKLEKSVLDKLLKGKVNTIELIFKLTEEDLRNMGLTEEDQDVLEGFLRDYLSKSKK